MKFLNKKRGFTLIELLVVIAIISLLSSVVFASLNSARAKASDALIKSNFKTIAIQAELFYSDHNSYIDGTTYTANDACMGGPGRACDYPTSLVSNTSSAYSLIYDPIIFKAFRDAKNQTGQRGFYYASKDSWAFMVEFKTADGWLGPKPDALCIDSTGKLTEYLYANGTGWSLPWYSYNQSPPPNGRCK